MTAPPVELEVRRIVAETASLPAEAVDLDRGLADQGVDSLGQVMLREAFERALGVTFSDGVWLGFRSLRQMIDYAARREDPSPGPARQGRSKTQGQAGEGSRPGGRLAGGAFVDEIEIGMSLTGRNNLAEGPLLQYLGELRWRHISALCGAPSKELADLEGNRLYATFFFVEMAFPPDRPMASLGENDHLYPMANLTRYGDSMLDGLVCLFPAGPQDHELRFRTVSEAVAAGIPSARLSNVFVRQFSGAEWLKKSRPANPGFARIPESALAPDSYTEVKQAEKAGAFDRPGPTYLPLTAGPTESDYKLVPDRDLNGAGLVYFANYPLILDIAEREVLGRAELKLSDELIDRRTLVRRRSAYLNNASSRDTLRIEVEAWIENPVRVGHPEPAMAPIRLFVNYRMYRRSDERLMMISTAEKVIFGRPLEEVAFFSRLVSAEAPPVAPLPPR